MSKPRIVTLVPFAPDMNLGRAYNESMALLPEGAWACFLDHDMMLTTREWYRQLEEAIEFLPDAGAFTAVTNRIGAKWQRRGDPNNHNIDQQRQFGALCLRHRGLLDITDTKGFGGVLMCISKAAWRAAGGFVDGMLCVDHQMHAALRRAGRRVYLIEGLYVYHWRRAFGDELPPTTPRAADCHCHRDEHTTPTIRLWLPEARS